MRMAHTHRCLQQQNDLPGTSHRQPHPLMHIYQQHTVNMTRSAAAQRDQRRIWCMPRCQKRRRNPQSMECTMRYQLVLPGPQHMRYR